MVRGDVSASPLDDELVLYDPTTNGAFILNPTAARIWALCDGSRTVAGLARDLAAIYGLERQAALQDVHEFLDELRDAGLLGD